MEIDLHGRRMRLVSKVVAIAVCAGFYLSGLWTCASVRADEKAPALPAATSEAKPADTKPGDGNAADGKPADVKKVSDAEQLEFQQAKVSAEMTELEQRMFRLSETLKPLEPENSSRLMLGVKFAREELIVHQMKQIQQQMRAASLAESVIEQKQLLAKLERLEQLLLSADLDFQMRLERLRQIREVLRRLDTVIREEDRERKLSEQAAAKEARASEAEKRAAGIQKLIEREMSHIADLEALVKDKDADAPKLAAEQAKTREATAALSSSSEDTAKPEAGAGEPHAGHPVVGRSPTADAGIRGATDR